MKNSSKEKVASSKHGSKISLLLATCYLLLKAPIRYWQASLWHKIVTVVVAVILVIIGTMYGIARWYIWQEGSQPVTYGVSFIPDYAEFLGVNPQQNMDALINIGVKEFRLTSYWSDIETSPGKYDFSQLDWEFQKADAAGAKIILTVGLRQPRWPECHAPSFYDTSKPESQWYPALKKEMTAVVNRYKNNPALQGWQIENEYFLKGFGDCTDMNRQRLINETNLVRKLDPKHEIIIPRSNNAWGWPVGKPQPDEFSVSIYRRVWDATVTHRYLEYPFPAWFYAFTAGWQKIMTGHDMIIGELQAEPWPPHGQTIPQTSLAEQNKSFNAERLKTTAQFAEATGMKTINFWGAEYWYYRKTVLHDPSVWNEAKQIFQNSNQSELY